MVYAHCIMSLAARFRRFVGDEARLLSSGGRRDTAEFQSQVASLLQELSHIENFIHQLNLYSGNEGLDEVNPLHIQYLTTDYHFAQLYSVYCLNPKLNLVPPTIDPTEYKLQNLELSKNRLLHFLNTLQLLQLLTAEQSKRIDLFKESYSPTYAELVEAATPTAKRDAKIANHKLEKELDAKLAILELHYASDGGQDDPLSTLDEETVRAIYTDQLRLLAVKLFSALEQIVMELAVLARRPAAATVEPGQRGDNRTNVARSYGPQNDYGYTTKLESLTRRPTDIPSLISKQGKILQPFTITSDRQSLQRKVRGTGQVLPSMSVEEYLDYELANGKMVSEDTNAHPTEDASDDSDAELEKRQWDNWKDDNPKGAGNTGANIG